MPPVYRHRTMLSDRSYMRRETDERPVRFLAWFLGAIAVVFVLQRVAEVFFRSDALLRYGALSADELRDGQVWTLLSYALLHGNLTHLLINGLGLFFVGRILQDALGSTRLAWLTVVGALGGAAAWLAVYFNRPGSVIGASGIVMAYLTVFACLYLWRRVTLLVFFIIPVTIQPVWLIAVVGGMELIGFLLKELPGSGTFYGITHAAHLGGMAAGWLFYRFAIVARRSRSGASIEAPAWLRKRGARPAPAYTVNIEPVASATPPPAATTPTIPQAPPTATARAAMPPPSSVPREALKAEVDRILDKISLHGIASLSDSEKRVLDEARQQLSHR